MRTWILHLLGSRLAIRRGAALPSALGRPVDDAHVEIRSYNLKPGTRDRFHQLFLKEALPMLNRWKVDVIAYGPSLHDKDSYFLMRAFEASTSGRSRRMRSTAARNGSRDRASGCSPTSIPTRPS